MRGASALEKVLSEEAGKKLRLIVVWMPVIASDVGPPSTHTLARISDARAMQLWDPDQVVSEALKVAGRAHPEWLDDDDERAEVRRDDFVVWEFVAVFPPGARWDGGPPKPIFHGGPVVRVIDGLRKQLAAP